LNDTNLNNSFKIHHIKKRKKHFHQCTRGDSNRQPQQLSAGAPAAQIYTPNMLSVSIGAHKYAACFYWRPPSSYLCAQQHKFRQKYGEAFYWVEQQRGFA
jgi:hypothetical protein